MPCRTSEGVEGLNVQVGLLVGLLGRNVSIQFETIGRTARGTSCTMKPEHHEMRTPFAIPNSVCMPAIILRTPQSCSGPIMSGLEGVSLYNTCAVDIYMYVYCK